MNLKKASLAVVAALTFGATASFAVNVGDIVTFGRYPTGRYSEVVVQPEKRVTFAGRVKVIPEVKEKRYEQAPISWIVLKVEGDKTLLVSNEGLDCKKYNEQEENVTWETCTLRKWLNKDFINTAFTNEEQAKICTVTLQNPNNPKYGTRGGNATQDKVFCLSIQEAQELFPFDEARTCKPTRLAVARGAGTSGSEKYKGNGWCWLRSPGNFSNYAAYVDYDGGIDSDGVNVNYGPGSVRPALWVSNL